MQTLSSSKRNYLILIGVSFLRFTGDALFYAFLARYFDTLGFSNGQLGLLLSVIPFMAVIGNSVLSKIATSIKRNVLILEVWTLIESTFIMLSGSSTSFWFVLMYDIICNFCSNSFYNLLDTFILPISEKAGKTYAAGRLFGTVFYIGSVFFGGMLIERITYRYTFLIGGAMMLMAGLAFLLIKFDEIVPDKSSERKDDEDDEEQTDVSGRSAYRKILGNRNFIFYGLFISVLLGSHWASDNIYNLYTNYLKVSDSSFGYFFSGAICMEAAMLLIFSRIRNPKSLKFLISFAGLALICRMTVFAIPDLNVYVYLSVEVFRGTTYGLILVCNLKLIQNILGKRLMYRGFFLVIAVDEALAGTLDLMAPTIIAATSYTFMFSIIAVLGVISLVFLSLVRIRPQRKSNQAMALNPIQNTAPIDKKL